MKSIFFKLLTVATFLFLIQGCGNDDLPSSRTDLYQVQELTAIAGDMEATLNWVAPDKGTPEEYLLTWTTATEGAEGGQMTVGNDRSSAIASNLVNNAGYTFSIQARYAGGLSGKISTVVVPVSDRAPVSGLTAAAGSGKVKLKWTPPQNDMIQGYLINVEPGNTNIAVDDPLTESYIVDQLTNDIEYTFSVYGVYAKGNSVAVTASAIPGMVFPAVVANTTVAIYERIVFAANEMYFMDDEIASVNWDFGDGSTSAEKEPTHFYTVTGSHTVTVNVTYADFNTASGTMNMTVTGYKWTSMSLNNGLYTGYVKTSNVVFSPDGTTIYVPTSTPAGNLFAVDAVSGAIKWVFAMSLTYGGGSVVDADGIIYQGNNAGEIYAINPDGTQKWGKNLGATIDVFPALSGDGILYVLTNNASTTTPAKVYALNCGDGSTRWSENLDYVAGGALAVGNDGTVYAGTNGAVYAFTANGVRKWVTTVNLSLSDRGAFAIHGTRLYAALRSGAGLAAIDTPDGNVAWTYPTGNNNSAYFPIVDRDGVIYFAQRDGTAASNKVCAVNPDGTLKWEKTIGAALIYTGLALGDNGVVYGGTQAKIDGNYLVFGIQTATGEYAFQEACAEQIMSAVTIGPDKRLYVGTIGSGNIGSIFAYPVNAGSETASWSVRGGDVQGSNRQK